jgi:sensor histidine kinase YesM
MFSESKTHIIKIVLGHFRDLLVVVIIGNIISFLFSMDFTNIWVRIGWNSLYSGFIGMVLWKGNQFIGWYIDRRYDAHKNPYKVLRLNLISMFTYTIIAILLVNYIWFVLIFDWNVLRFLKSAFSTMLIEFVVTVIITSIFYSMGFFQAWRESAVNEERLEKESIKLQYKALKNQVNPHFLFNSLNSLTSLVYQDQDQAVKFIKQLSEVYRYVLEHKDNELVNLDDEINFAKKYAYLQKIRNDDGLNIVFDVANSGGKYIVPVALQMIIENAIKHNEASAENPLNISVSINGEFVIIENNLQLKKVLRDSGGVGLSTLKARYEFLSEKGISIEKTNEYYRISIPLLTNIHHEGFDHRG